MLGDWPGELHIEVEGPDLSKLEHETGGHRIQRIPPTERKGRVHTSTVTVALVDPTLPTLKLDDKDFVVEWYSGTGAGGQHRNKHQNSCRLTHKPSGIVVTAQCRSRQESEAQARKTLLERLDQEHRQRLGKANASLRKEQVGSGQRGDKMRTYRFQDDSVKDHALGTAACLSKVMRGNFDLLW